MTVLGGWKQKSHRGTKTWDTSLESFQNSTQHTWISIWIPDGAYFFFRKCPSPYKFIWTPAVEPSCSRQTEWPAGLRQGAACMLSALHEVFLFSQAWVYCFVSCWQTPRPHLCLFSGGGRVLARRRQVENRLAGWHQTIYCYCVDNINPLTVEKCDSCDLSTVQTHWHHLQSLHPQEPQQ